MLSFIWKLLFWFSMFGFVACSNARFNSEKYTGASRDADSSADSSSGASERNSQVEDDKSGKIIGSTSGVELPGPEFFVTLRAMVEANILERMDLDEFYDEGLTLGEMNEYVHGVWTIDFPESNRQKALTDPKPAGIETLQGMYFRDLEAKHGNVSFQPTVSISGDGARVFSVQGWQQLISNFLIRASLADADIDTVFDYIMSYKNRQR